MIIFFFGRALATKTSKHCVCDSLSIYWACRVKNVCHEEIWAKLPVCRKMQIPVYWCLLRAFRSILMTLLTFLRKVWPKPWSLPLLTVSWGPWVVLDVFVSYSFLFSDFSWFQCFMGHWQSFLFVRLLPMNFLFAEKRRLMEQLPMVQ